MDNQFEGMKEVKTSTIKMGKIGDWFKGTLTDNSRQVPNTLSAKQEMQTVYEFKIHGGSFHNNAGKLDEEVVELKAGDFWSYFAKPAIQSQMRNAKLGQIIGMRFVEEKAPTQPGRNATKIIKVYLGDMDSEYQGESAGFGFAGE